MPLVVNKDCIEHLDCFEYLVTLTIFILQIHENVVSLHLCCLQFISLMSYNFCSTGLLPPSVQFSSVAQLCPTLCDHRSTPGLPVHHQLPEFTQTHVHRVRDAIQPSHPLSSPSPPAPNSLFLGILFFLMQW